MKKLLIVLGAAALLGGGCGKQAVKNLRLGAAPIVCFGDSLTAGDGARPGESYPAILGRLTGREVINAGAGGETSADALKRIDRDVLSRKPGLALVEFGANDFFQQIPKRETMANLEKIVDILQGAGAAVALLEVRLGIMDPYLKEFKALAKKKQVLLISNIMAGILTDPGLKSDQIHPNARGYALMAGRIYKKLKPYF